MIDYRLDKSKVEGEDYEITYFDWKPKNTEIHTREFDSQNKMRVMSYESYLTRFKNKWNKEFQPYKYYVVDRTAPGDTRVQITLIKVKRSVG